MQDKNYVPKKEVWTYSIAALGQGLVYSCMSSYITDYYMNVLTLNAMFVIVLMLVARVWDAVNDPMMGMLVDRHKTKWGRMKPYPVLTALPIAILTVLMFVNPGFDTSDKSVSLYIYVTLVYVLWGMIYTISDVAYWGMPNVMTPNPKERGNIISYARTTGGVGSAVTVALPIIMGYILASSENADVLKYAIMAISMAIIGMPLFCLSSFKVKERIDVPNTVSRKISGQPSAVSRIIHCKPLMLVVLSGILSFGRYMLQSAAAHVGRYAGLYIGIDPETATAEQLYSNISTVQLIIQICAAVGMFSAMLFMPKLFKKFEYKSLMIYSCLGGFVASIFTLVIGWTTKNLLLCIPFMLLSSMPLGVINIVSFAMICDCLDYMEWQTGFRDTAMGAACQSFVNKLGNAFATVVIIAMYIVVSIDVEQMNVGSSDAIVNIAQNLTTSQNFAMFSLVTIIPGLSLLLCAVPIFFYDITGAKKEKIFKELAERREARGVRID